MGIFNVFKDKRSQRTSKQNLIDFISNPFHRQFFLTAGITEDDMSDSELRVAFPLSRLSGYFTFNYEIADSKRPATPYSMMDMYKVPAVNQEGICRYISLNKNDIDKSSKTLTGNLKIQLSDLDNNRFPVFVTYGIFAVICYSATTVNKQQIENYLGLQRDLERCLSGNVVKTSLDDLNNTPNWRDNFIRPFLEDVKSKLLIKGWKH
ncbi:MAG: hypothetical protein Q7R50_03510 [Dehalococcoidales bacterium]|nr:hypothetical protein [Dehalococcoidales bacterium]